LDNHSAVIVRFELLALNEVIQKEKIDAMAMEQLFFFKNAKTVIGVAQAQGAVIALAAAHDLAFHFLTPLQIKQIVTVS
jgi:crossover junction endodeoxyribonuclease RuvC